MFVQGPGRDGDIVLAFGFLLGRDRHFPTPDRVLEQGRDRIGKIVSIALPHEQPRHPISNYARHASASTGYHRQPCRLSLEQRHAEGFLDCRPHVEIGRAVK
jgi:hypothetical protein